ncbi:NnrU family protein [Tropicimonas sp. IMCC6043]|uniref:NnrU family protein n=1 Tax=Tropicimonas sp. IMCC6043 TaxID=2510645 RepID=UPI00101DCFE1|nr:NnrU family protein [Tropicimonas sp. IMCC6043]RYH08938.1 NnrU family protein [Tropicimonas sp. IMCC6043]
MSILQGWGEFVVAILVFLASHSLPVRPRTRGALVARLGTTGFTLAYSAISLAALGWLIVATRRAPVIPLWDWAPWQNHVTYAAMALACVIAALAIGRPNPLSFGGAHNNRFDPAAPGIVGWVRHPLLVALLLWSLGHLLPNGQLAPVLLFALFAGFSLLGMRMIDRRRQRQLGRAEWRRLAGGPRRLDVTRAGLLRTAAGLATYAGLIALHGPVIGVAPAF